MTSYPVCPHKGCHTPMTKLPLTGHYVCADCGALWRAGAVLTNRRWFQKDVLSPLPGYWPEIGFEAQSMPGL